MSVKLPLICPTLLMGLFVDSPWVSNCLSLVWITNTNRSMGPWTFLKPSPFAQSLLGYHVFAQWEFICAAVNTPRLRQPRPERNKWEGRHAATQLCLPNSSFIKIHARTQPCVTLKADLGSVKDCGSLVVLSHQYLSPYITSLNQNPLGYRSALICWERMLAES